MAAQAPQHERPGEDLRQAVPKDVRLIAPMEIPRHRLARDQRKQEGTDREIDEGELGEGFHWQSPIEERPKFGAQCRRV